MKERYIKMRNDRVIDWQFLYDYMLSKGFNLGVESFNAGAQHLMIKINDILEQLDHEYELTTLYDKQGNFIKVIL